MEDALIAFEQLAAAACEDRGRSVLIEVAKGSVAAQKILEGFERIRTEDGQAHPLEREP